MRHLIWLALAAALLVTLAVPLTRQTLKGQAYQDALAGGVLLTPSTRFRGALFKGTTILLVSHGDHGALGLVLGTSLPAGVERLTAVSSGFMEELQAGQRLAAQLPIPMPYWGGPVDLDRISIISAMPRPGLVRFGDHDLYATLGIAPLEAKELLSNGVDDWAGATLFLGYAGWRPGQLEAEIRNGSWQVHAANSHRVRQALALGATDTEENE